MLATKRWGDCRASEGARKASEPAERASKGAGRSSNVAGRASEAAGRTSDGFSVGIGTVKALRSGTNNQSKIKTVRGKYE